MTDTPKPDALLAVTQDDRNLAAEMAEAHGFAAIGACYRSGLRDHHTRVQVIARHRLASAPAAAVEPSGTYACPICGKDTPHYHSPAEIEQHRDTERWVAKSWQQAKAQFFPDPTRTGSAGGRIPIIRSLISDAVETSNEDAADYAAKRIDVFYCALVVEPKGCPTPGACSAIHSLIPPAAAVEGREIVEAAQAAALRMWRVHPNDLDDMDYKHVGRGGRYDNPRAAYYADEIMKIVRLAAPSAPPFYRLESGGG